MSEADLLASIVDLAHLFGWRVAHFRPALTAKGWRTPVAADGKGFPDLVLTRSNRGIAVECKSTRGRLTTEQREWLSAFEGAGFETYCWRPFNWPDHIKFVLQRKGEPQP